MRADLADIFQIDPCVNGTLYCIFGFAKMFVRFYILNPIETASIG